MAAMLQMSKIDIQTLRRAYGRVKTEDDPLDPNPPHATRRTLEAIRRLEALVSGVSGMTGIVLRYGSFYGPGTSIAPDGDIVRLIRRRKFPIVGNGAGVWSFIPITTSHYVPDVAAGFARARHGGMTRTGPWMLPCAPAETMWTLVARRRSGIWGTEWPLHLEMSDQAMRAVPPKEG